MPLFSNMLISKSIDDFMTAACKIHLIICDKFQKVCSFEQAVQQNKQQNLIPPR